MLYGEIKDIIKFDYDIADKEIDCLIYYDFMDDNEVNNIEVVSIKENTITLDFYKYFIKNYKHCVDYIKKTLIDDLLKKYHIEYYNQNDYSEDIIKTDSEALNIYSLYLYAVGFDISDVF